MFNSEPSCELLLIWTHWVLEQILRLTAQTTNFSYSGNLHKSKMATGHIFLNTLEPPVLELCVIPLLGGGFQYVDSQVVTSKQPKLGLTQELFFGVELVSPLQVTHLPPVWDLLLSLA